ncbi:hypothetical protein ES319_1Z103300v1 [Gossypium barbadense]|uniref:Uncharacterized protein n=1 Tax=Gossypium barbadense TaxID=3634 RepID=A0A5J5N8U5_GOSBA|nr:hypothetical protein ES319_1Z103300v1 [Gossypium barbadense]
MHGSELMFRKTLPSSLSSEQNCVQADFKKKEQKQSTKNLKISCQRRQIETC